MKLIIFESVCVKVRIYCIFISKVENKILKSNPQKMHMLMCTFNETGVLEDFKIVKHVYM